MIAAGCLTGVDLALGLHLWVADPVGTIRVHPGPIMANSDHFRIVVTERGGHGSEPEKTQDAILLAAQLIVNLQTIVSRRISAFDPVVVSCGTIKGGTVFNAMRNLLKLPERCAPSPTMFGNK